MLGGYLVDNALKALITTFVTYHKNHNISDSIKYEDKFINREFDGMSIA
jgi:hypothetical protein